MRRLLSRNPLLGVNYTFGAYLALKYFVLTTAYSAIIPGTQFHLVTSTTDGQR